MQKKTFKGITGRSDEKRHPQKQDNIKSFIQSVTQLENIKKEMIFIIEEETDWISVRYDDIVFTSEELFAIHIRTGSIANSMVCRFINRLNGLDMLPWIDDYVLKTNGLSDYKLIFIYASNCYDELSDD